MKRMLIFSVLIAFLLGAMAYATETRVMTMGDVNNVVKDDANILLYPSTINYYPKLFLGEVTSGVAKAADPWLYQVGANMQFAEASEYPWVVGAYFSTVPFNSEILRDYHPSIYFNENNRISLYLGRVLGETPFGLNVNFFNQSAKNEDEDSSLNYTTSLNRYEFALGISPMEKKLDLAAGVAFTTWTDQMYVDAPFYEVEDSTKPKSNMDLYASARYWMDPIGGWGLVPHLTFAYSKQGLESYYDSLGTWTLDFTEKYTRFGFDLGLGMNYEATENVLLVTDLGFRWVSLKDKYEPASGTSEEGKWTYLTLPYFKIGFDGQVFKWLDFRGGVVTMWQFDKYEPSSVEMRKYKYASTDTYLGAGFHWGNLTLDASINPRFLTNGPNFVSGGNSSPLADRVTLKYMF